MSLPITESPDRSFQARFGATILRGGIAAVPAAIFTYQQALDLSPQEIWFIAYILARKWSTDLPHPSLRKMAERTGYSEQQLHRIKNSLLGKGYLRLVERHQANGGQASNAYDFSDLFGRLEALLIRDGVAGAEIAADDGDAGVSASKGRRAVHAAQAGGVPPTNIYVSAPANNSKPIPTPTNIDISGPSNTGMTPPLTPRLVAPLTPLLDEEEADPAEAKRSESSHPEPPLSPVVHIPLVAVPPLREEGVVEGEGALADRPGRAAGAVTVPATDSAQVREDTRLLVVFGLDEETARECALVAERNKQLVGYVSEQIEYVQLSPGIKDPVAVLVANIQKNRRRKPPAQVTPPPLVLVPAPDRPEPTDTPAAALLTLPSVLSATTTIWNRALAYLNTLCPGEQEKTLRYVQLAELDAEGGTALLTVPNDHLRRAVERLADSISLALHQAGQPPLRIVVAIQQADQPRPTLAGDRPMRSNQ